MGSSSFDIFNTRVENTRFYGGVELCWQLLNSIMSARTGLRTV